MMYNNRLLTDYNIFELELLKSELEAAEAKREEASKHFKFDTVNNKNAMPFPPTNPKFLELKNAVIEEIGKRNNV